LIEVRRRLLVRNTQEQHPTVAWIERARRQEPPLPLQVLKVGSVIVDDLENLLQRLALAHDGNRVHQALLSRNRLISVG